MPKSNISDILEVQRLIGKLDKRGKLAILRDLQRQGLFEPDITKEPVKEKEGEEQ